MSLDLEKTLDTAKVVGANAGAITITASGVQQTLSIISIVLAIGYTIWKWRRDFKKG